MNPSAGSSESRGESGQSALTVSNNQTFERVDALNDEKGCMTCFHRLVNKICERWFLSLGIIAILFIIIGFFIFSSNRHGEVLVFAGGFLVLLSTFMVSQRQGRRRTEEEQVIRRASNALSMWHQEGRIHRRASDPIYTISQPPCQLSADDTGQISMPPPVMLTSMYAHPYWMSPSRDPKQDDDKPPSYENVVSQPPPYESLNPANFPS